MTSCLTRTAPRGSDSCVLSLRSWFQSAPSGESEALPEGFCIIESRDSVKVLPHHAQ